MSDRKIILQEIVNLLAQTRKHFMPLHLINKTKSTLTPAQIPLLVLIEQNSGISIKKLSEFLGISSSAVTQLVDNLVRNKLLVRKEDLKDRRIINLFISEKAIKLKNNFEQMICDKSSKVFEILDDQELAQFHKLTSKVSTNLISQSQKS
ncbi:MAG: MarR family transcriptional regulator [bacterium]